AGDADDAAPLRLGQLGDDAADCAGGRGDENRLAGLCAADVRQAEVGGHPRHAEGTEPGGHRGDVEIEAVDPLPVGDGVLPHTDEAPDCVPDCEVGVVGGDDPPSGVGAHDLTDTHRWDVGAHVVQPATHGRIEGDLLDLHDELTGTGLGDIDRGELPRAPTRSSLGALGQADLL